MYVKDYIKMEDLKDGYLYKIIARNASYGIWRSETKGFTISRIKFYDNFAFEEYHYDCESFATAQPIEKIEKSPFDPKDLHGETYVSEKDGKKYWRFVNEDAVLEYLNKVEKGRDYNKSANTKPKWLKDLKERFRKERLEREKRKK